MFVSIKKSVVFGLVLLGSCCFARAQAEDPLSHFDFSSAASLTESTDGEVIQVSQLLTPKSSCVDFSDDGSCNPGCVPTCSSNVCSPCCDDRLFGLFRRSERCFPGFISPMTNPVFFEDPRTLTEVRTIFINQRIPFEAANGEVRLIAAQMRAALTERLSIVAAKDGFITSTNPLVDDGWADVSVGLKYNLVRDVCTQTIISAGLTYELPIGSTRALQGNGDGEFNIYLTGGKEFFGNTHFLTDLGFRLPTDTTAETQSFYWSSHLDAEILRGIYVFGETNWYHRLKSGNGALNGIDGTDLFNLGSTGVAGTDVVTGALGFKIKPNHKDEIGIAYEIPLTDRRGLMKNRFTLDYILRY